MGVEPTMHDALNATLRHTHATLLLLAGIHLKVVSECLGYANISITLDTYSHVLPNMQQETAEKLEAMLFAPKDEEIQDKMEAGNEISYLELN